VRVLAKAHTWLSKNFATFGKIVANIFFYVSYFVYISTVIKTKQYMNIKINRAEEQVIREALSALRYKKEDLKKDNTIVGILNKIMEAGLIRTERQPKQLLLKKYMFTFDGGGWNTVWAKTKRGAIKAANLEYKNDDSLTPLPNSFHIATEAGEKAAMSLFH
tara:strand:+ start:288 stop:773 length:486 start_codon:yes stop_codon:yes gene_type:complete